MPGPPPPPPPGPPPAPGIPPPPLPAFNASKSSSSGDGRNQLLQSIRQGAKLKKTVTVDKSAPVIPGKTTASSNNNATDSPLMGNGVGPRGPVQNGAMALGGLFAGGMPKLKPIGSGSVNNKSITNNTSKASETTSKIQLSPKNLTVSTNNPGLNKNTGHSSIKSALETNTKSLKALNGLKSVEDSQNIISQSSKHNITQQPLKNKSHLHNKFSKSTQEIQHPHNFERTVSQDSTQDTKSKQLTSNKSAVHAICMNLEKSNTIGCRKPKRQSSVNEISQLFNQNSAGDVIGVSKTEHVQKKPQGASTTGRAPPPQPPPPQPPVPKSNIGQHSLVQTSGLSVSSSKLEMGDRISDVSSNSKTINFGKPNIAPKPPGVAPTQSNSNFGIQVKKVNTNGMPVSRAQSFKVPRSPPPCLPSDTSGSSLSINNGFSTLRPSKVTHSEDSFNRRPMPGVLKTSAPQPPLARVPSRPPLRPPTHCPPPPPNRPPNLPPPPPPPHRHPSPTVSSFDTLQSGAPPQPPIRNSSIRTSEKERDLDSRFFERFHPIAHFPFPDAFLRFEKTYASRSTTNIQTTNIIVNKQQAPPPPPMMHIQLGTKLWADDSSAC